MFSVYGRIAATMSIETLQRELENIVQMSASKPTLVGLAASVVNCYTTKDRVVLRFFGQLLHD